MTLDDLLYQVRQTILRKKALGLPYGAQLAELKRIEDQFRAEVDAELREDRIEALR